MRDKTKKLRGRKTHGYGARKKHRGGGSQGGKGMAGTGKRGDQKKTWVLAKVGKKYFGKKGFVPVKDNSIKEINLDRISELMPLFIEKNYADKSGNINLKKAGYTKLLARGKLNGKYSIKVESYSKRAKEKVEELGGSVEEIKSVSKEVVVKKE